MKYNYRSYEVLGLVKGKGCLKEMQIAKMQTNKQKAIQAIFAESPQNISRLSEEDGF